MEIILENQEAEIEFLKTIFPNKFQDLLDLGRKYFLDTTVLSTDVILILSQFINLPGEDREHRIMSILTEYYEANFSSIYDAKSVGAGSGSGSKMLNEAKEEIRKMKKV